jgi:putative tryptophan/tyrosine transport system permease protein
MSLIQIIGALELGFIYSLVALGVYLSFRTLQFPDLTVDGSFPLGAAVAATWITTGGNPVIATFLAFAAGALMGVITAWLSTHLRVLNLLAGILTMTALYSINLRIMGRPNIALLGESTILSGWLTNIPQVIVLAVISVLILGILWHFLSSRIGLALRATGANARMARAQGINDNTMIWLGLGAANALVALGGALFAQVNGFADVTLGVGTIIIGLAAVIIGEALLPTRTIFQALIACLVGSLVYRLVIAQALNINEIGLKASDLNLVTAVLVGLAMTLPTLKQHFKKSRGGKS